MRDLRSMKVNFFLNLIFIYVVSLFLGSCSSTESGFASLFPDSTSSNYFKKSSEITVEVYYEPGAEPFDGSIGLTGTPLWNITESNINELFSFKSISPGLNIPKSLSEMNMIGVQNKNQWTIDDVINLYKTNHTLSASTTSAVFYIYFVNGNSSSSNGIIGFSINTTPVIAIFKDVIKNSGRTEAVQKFVEQATIVHELGHAFGLVNNGIPLNSLHQDTAHGAHTKNEDCVMYWLNEGVSDLVGFIGPFRSSGETRMWGPEVLADAQAFSD